MHFSKSLLVAAVGAGSVSARSVHKHRHADLHQEQARAVGDTVIATIEGQVVSWVNEYAGGAAATSTAAAATVAPAATTSAAAVVQTSAAAVASSPAAATATASATASAAGSSSTEATTYEAFCSSSSSKKRATMEEIAYKGDTGSCGWGSNIKLVAADIADKYDYTVKMSGQNTEPWTVVCWNKIGPDGLTDGWYGHKAVEFSLAAGATQYIAFEENSQGGCAAAEGDSVPTDSDGGWAATWFEFDFADTANSGWSGADVSSIQVQNAGLDIQGMRACHSGTCSTITGSAVVATAIDVLDNAFSAAEAAVDGLGLNIPAGSCQINVEIDYSA